MKVIPINKVIKEIEKFKITNEFSSQVSYFNNALLIAIQIIKDNIREIPDEPTDKSLNDLADYDH